MPCQQIYQLPEAGLLKYAMCIATVAQRLVDDKGMLMWLLQ